MLFWYKHADEKLEAALKDLKEGDVLLVENTRYEDLDGKKESKNESRIR